MAAYQGCHERFVRYCSALAYGKMDTEDLVQDVLLSAYKNFDKIEKQDQMLHYLIRAARNQSVSHWRKRRKQSELLEKHTERLVSKGVSVEVLIDVQLLYRTLQELPEKQRDALLLFEVSGFSMAEIAEIQGSTEGAVKTNISRGRKRLRQMLDDDPHKPSSGSIFQSLQTVLL